MNCASDLRETVADLRPFCVAAASIFAANTIKGS